MTTLVERRTIWDAMVREPIDLIIAQPPQILISAASVFLIAAEAEVLLPYPANIMLAVGAEWGYLRGMASASHVETPWKNRLTWANGALVVLYGALFSLRKFGVLPSVDAYHAGTAHTDTFGAILMTIIHIACIGAITICAMMAHSDMQAEEARVNRLEVAERNQRNQRNQAADEARNRLLRESEDALLLEMRRKDAELRLEKETARQKMQLDSERAQLRSATRSAVAPQPVRNQIIIDGVTYPSVQAAADAHGITRQAMSKRLKKEAS